MRYVKIKEINESGVDSVYHLTVEKNHNFFANKLCVHNCDYRGEVNIILINHKQESFTINPGDRIAQGVIASCVTTNYANLVEVKEINSQCKTNYYQ